MKNSLFLLVICFAFCFTGCGLSGSGSATSNGVSTATYRDITGTIESIDENSGTIKVNHGDIPGYMPAMTMDYTAKDKSLLGKLKKGDQIQFNIEVNAGIVVISEIHKK